MNRIYLDHAATTPVLPSVVDAMLPWLREEFGNPSSMHADGRHAKGAIDEARETLSQAFGCLFAEVVFTGGGTEAANLAIIGSALWAIPHQPDRKRILFSSAEHHCVLHTRSVLKRLGFKAESVPVDRYGRIRLDVLEQKLGEDVLLVSCMHANNELGTWQPVEEVARLAHSVGARFHCDAVQSFSYPWSVDEIGADLATVCAHKLGGPKGVGAIYLRAGTLIEPLVLGGGQERELRAGTENVAAIVGFAEAVRQRSRRPKPTEARNRLRDRLVAVGGVPSIPDDVPHLDSHLHIRFPGVTAETLLIRLDLEGISASAGSACSSGSLNPSHVMLACGFGFDEAREGVRFSLGPETSVAEAMEAGERIASAVEAIRSVAPVG